jgi:excinuclease UvrABC helicase subunit UvrB
VHIDKVKKIMEKEAKDENFIEAARLRDEIFQLMNLLKTK